jgi:hypothetical protein
MTPKPLHLSGNPQISYPPYLSNGEQLWLDYCTIGLRTLGGVGHLKTPKKKHNFGGDTHVTLNPKPSYNSIFSAKLHIIPYFQENFT